MADILTLQVSRPIQSAVLISIDSAGGDAGDFDNPAKRAEAQASRAMQEIQEEKARIAQLSQALGSSMERLNDYEQKLVSKNNKEIAKLAVEIARKILAQKISEKDYEIETIVSQAIKASPAKEIIALRLNPEDAAKFEELSKAEPDGVFKDINLHEDDSIGPGECVLETPKGIVECFIEDQLQRIAETLGSLN